MTIPVQRLARLRRRLAAQFALRDISLPLDGCDHPWLITTPADPDAPLDTMAAEQARNARQPTSAQPQPATTDAQQNAAEVARATVASGAHLPYWALVWPSGLALAESLLARPSAITHGRTLEIGCGLGVTAAVAATLGADITICDLFPEALLFAGYNVSRRAGRLPHTLLLNWRTAEGQRALIAAGPFDTLLAADVLYEEEDIEPLLALAPQLLTPSGVFWLAEPGRKASRAFVTAARARGWDGESIATEREWPPDGDHRLVTTHLFTPR